MFSNTKKQPLIGQQLSLALSGGRDSCVLLHYLVSHFDKQNIRVLHVNHQLQKDANKWQRFCQDLCQHYGIECEVFTAVPAKKNIEQHARNERYRLFTKTLRVGEYLCTAHHQQDQAETLLLQLCRGAGNYGLAAMALKKPFGRGFLYRPLLDTSTQEIAAYAKHHQLKWYEDPSNQNEHFRRNHIRHNILPQLNTQQPNICANLARSAKHQQETKTLLKELAEHDIKTHQLLSKDGRFFVDKLRRLSIVRLKNVLRFYMDDLSWQQPSEKILTSIVHDVLGAKIDAKPLVKWQQYSLRRYQNELYFIDETVNQNRPKSIENGIEIRHRQGGERCRLKGAKHTRPLKKILQEKRIPPWQRDKLALYYRNNQLIAIEDIGEVEFE